MITLFLNDVGVLDGGLEGRCDFETDETLLDVGVGEVGGDGGLDVGLEVRARVVDYDFGVGVAH